MSHRWFAVAAIGVPLLFAGSARAAGMADRSEIQAKYDAYRRAMIARDAAGVMAITAPDFTLKVPGQALQNRAQAEAGLKQMLSSTRKVERMQVRIRRLAVRGAKAVANTESRTALTAGDRNGKVHRITDNSVSRDIWTKTAGGWFVKSIRITSDRMTMDGKPYNPAAAGKARPTRKP